MEHELTKGQQQFFDDVMAGKSVFLQGKAGTGKTYITKLVVEALKKAEKTVAVCAPTGIAANNAGGVTMHSLFALPVGGVITYEECRFIKKAKRRMLDKIDVLLIDEVSMVRADMIDGIHWTLKKNGCDGLDTKQVVFIGDMGQLPPVADDNFKSVMNQVFQYKDIQFYHSRIFSQLSNISTINLDEVKRQDDPEFITNLNNVRDGKQAHYFRNFIGKPTKGIVLAPHKHTVTRYNIDGLNAIEGETYRFEATIDGKINPDDFNFDHLVEVKHGAKIMYLVNSLAYNNLVNGTIGTFEVQLPTDKEDDEDDDVDANNSKDPRFYIRVGEIRYRLEPVEVTKKEYVLDELRDELVLKTLGSIKQYPIRLAYALTIHKSQGLTFDEVTVDLREPCFSPGQLYVALSRVRTPEGLSIIR